MKKTLTLLIILFLIAISFDVKAQKAESLWIDLRGGLNTSFIVNQNAYGNGELDYATTFGFTAGLGASYFLTDVWGINASFTWAKIGQNYSGMQSSGDAKRKVKLNYLELPLLAMRKIEGTKVPTWIAFGPELMFLTGAKQDYHRKDGGPLPKGENMIEGITDIKERFKPVDIAMNITLSKMYDIYENSKFRLLLTANMAYGLTDMNSKDWRILNMKNKYDGSHNFYMGMKVGVMYRAFVKED
jgi:hypothetical protein